MTDMVMNKIYLCETTVVLTCFSQRQFSELNKTLVKDKKCRLYSSRHGDEIIYICEGCCVLFEEKCFQKFTFNELRKCLIEKSLKRSQLIYLPETLARII